MIKLADIWNERYSTKEYIYGEQPNKYLQEQLDKLPVGHILLAGEGEGRNAVYAARQGWKVTAFDISSEGKKKAQQLADKYNVMIDYRVGELQEMGFEEKQFDAIALIYTHLPVEMRSSIHKRLTDHLRPGGTLILEAFNKDHIRKQAGNPSAGGPKDINLLYSVDEIGSDFENYEEIEMAETEVNLNEGLYHIGSGSVIRFTGRKRVTGNSDD
ncbi:MAG: class I SAM-dependent methyltransferase [Bacteroidales bacterium]|jgi:SAM-dependent methyltransferase|nr:class I SAM-dependent methyltransferase [Bacteroidales bacterium]